MKELQDPAYVAILEYQRISLAIYETAEHMQEKGCEAADVSERVRLLRAEINRLENDKAKVALLKGTYGLSSPAKFFWQSVKNLEQNQPKDAGDEIFEAVKSLDNLMDIDEHPDDITNVENKAVSLHYQILALEFMSEIKLFPGLIVRLAENF